MIASADENLADGRLVLKVALEAEGGIALSKEFLVHRTMRLVTNEAAFAGGLVLVNERPSLLRMAIETDLGRPVRIDDGVASTASLVVDASGAVTGFAAHVHRVWTAHFEFGVGRRRKIARDIFMTFRARL